MSEIIDLISSVITPIVILVLGIFINKNIEKLKVTMTKENEWRNIWANKFLEVCNKYDAVVTKIVTELFILV